MFFHLWYSIIVNETSKGSDYIKRRNGEGTWGLKTIKGVEYKYFRNSNGKYFYGKTEKEIRQKIKKYESAQSLSSDKSFFVDFIKDWLFNVKRNQIKPRTFDN